MSSSSSSFDEHQDRRLCPDSACIGVLRADLTCPECGAVDTDTGSGSDSGSGSGVDLLYRSLCPDGACIGLLGADGRCRECGRVGAEVTTDPRLRGLKEDAAEDAPLDPVTPGEAPAPAMAELLFDDSPAEFAKRRLCPDGSCIGVIGKAGTCNECGMVA